MCFVTPQIHSQMRNIRTTHSIEYNSRERVDNMKILSYFLENFGKIYEPSLFLRVRIAESIYIFIRNTNISVVKLIPLYYPKHMMELFL